MMVRCCVSQFDSESLICSVALSTLKGGRERGSEREFKFIIYSQ